MLPQSSVLATKMLRSIEEQHGVDVLGLSFRRAGF